jgi:hypothetical protein
MSLSVFHTLLKQIILTLSIQLCATSRHRTLQFETQNYHLSASKLSAVDGYNELDSPHVNTLQNLVFIHLNSEFRSRSNEPRNSYVW